jgi:hypothetical protein
MDRRLAWILTKWRTASVMLTLHIGESSLVKIGFLMAFKKFVALSCLVIYQNCSINKVAEGPPLSRLTFG